MKRFASVPAERDAWRARWHALPQPMRRAITVLAWGLAVLLLVGVLFRGVIGNWLWPTQRAEDLRLQARAALEAGRLSAADGSGARELFEAALAMQPDQIAAREGLGRVAQAALAQAGTHADAGRIAHARIALRLARELQAPMARIDAMETRLQRMEAGDDRIAALLARAEAAHAAGRLDQGDDAALPLYQRVVLLQPRNQRALEGREDALEDLLEPATGAVNAGELARAADLIQRAEVFDAGHAALPALHAGLARALDAEAARIRRLVARNEYGAAAERCARLAGSDADALSATCGTEVIDGLLQQIDAAAAEFRFDGIERSMEQARALGAAAVRLQALQRRVRTARQDAARLPTASISSPRTRARVAQLLAQAERAQQRGHWLSPPGESAWDHLREARALAPADPNVAEALKAMVPAARRCNADALRDNNLGRAQVCLDAWQQLAPGDAGVRAARLRMAERWVAIGGERLGAGDVAGARAALSRAQVLQPGLPAAADLAGRLERAQ